MRAVAYQQPQPIANEQALIDVELPQPSPTGRDLLIEVRAVSVNPVDVKIRAGVQPEGGRPKVLGWDAAGVVVAAGPQASLFAPGDVVFYAGALNRPGTNAQYHLVDERIVGHMPRSLSFEQAAAIPLTAITAWEALFDRLDVNKPVPGAAQAIVIIGGAGGVGSMAIQLARHLTGLTVIATASRPASQAWVRQLGAHHVVSHAEPLAPQVAALCHTRPAFVLSTTHTEQHLPAIADLLAPQGRFALIDDPQNLDVMPLKRKSISLHWEFMFTRPLMNTADIMEQHRLLNEVSRLIDAGKIQTTLSETLRPINARTLQRAHAMVESQHMIGKVVVADW